MTEELDAPPRRNNRGFRIVAGSMLLACVVLVVAIVANRGLKDRIAHAQYTLRQAAAAAERIQERTGSFSGADAAGLAGEDRDRAYVDADTPSTSLDEVSVWALPQEWAGAVKVNDACFFIHSVGGELRYGVGTRCTGTQASGATDTQW